MEITLREALQKGIEAHKAGNIKEADHIYSAILKVRPKHPDANHNLGVLAVSIGKVMQALPYFKNALEANAKTPQFWLSYINALITLKRLDEAKTVLHQARSIGHKGEKFDNLQKKVDNQADVKKVREKIEIPSLKNSSNNLKNISVEMALRLAKGKKKKGLHDEAKTIYTEILAKFPQNKRANKEIKSLLQVSSRKLINKDEPPKASLESLIKLFGKGEYQEALTRANRLLLEFPDSVTLNNFNGIVNKKLGKIDEAILHFKKAIGHGPKVAELYYNLGNAFQDKGELGAALASYKQSLTIKPDYHEVYYSIGVVLKGQVFTKFDPMISDILLFLLKKETFVTPAEISSAIISILKFEPSIASALNNIGISDPISNIENTIVYLSNVPLLVKFMEVCPLPDLEFELLFKNIRAAILLNILDFENPSKILDFQVALAFQNFANEYICDATITELEALNRLEERVKSKIQGGEIPLPSELACIASYKPLCGYAWSCRLSWPSKLEAFHRRLVVEPNRELQIKSNLSALTVISDNISLKVQGQYEENPYPRWVNVGIPYKAKSILEIADVFNIRLKNRKIGRVRSPKILVAGCGTGQQSICTAARFQNSQVTAIDLSLRSLSYAVRRTQELGISNIEYLQADILDLEDLGRQFDFIECSGVLHHMADPLAAWNVLANCLTPDGILNIGLYSELARQPIVKTQQEIERLKIGSDNGCIKSFRANLIKSEESHHRLIKETNDFYSISMLRDLLFHIKEHRFTISQIKDCLSKLELEFCGFESKEILRKFKSINTEPDDPYDLSNWELFEKENPYTFVGMYQFWSQKVV